MDEGAVIRHDVLDVPRSVYVSRCVFCRYDVMFLVVGVEDKPVFPWVFVVAVFFVRSVVGREFNWGVNGPSSFALETVWDRERFVGVSILPTEELPFHDNGGGGFIPNAGHADCLP